MSNRHVLVVEDDVAEDGAEAIAAIQRETFCAIFLDLMMPRVNGYDVIAHIKNSALSPPVVVLTAAVKSLQSELLDPSIVKFVVKKPFDIQQLTTAIDALCPAD